MNDPPPVVEKDDEDEEDSTGDGWYGEEIDRAERGDVIREEGSPCLRRWTARPPQNPGNGSLRDLDAQLPNSPWIRGAPQSGFAAAIFITSVRMAAFVLGRPGRPRAESRVHRRRSHCRCQRTTVSG